MSATTSLAPPPPEAGAPPSLGSLPRGQIIGTLVGIMLALLLSALDQTIVGTAMPRIVAELGGFEQYAWVTTAYLLSSTAVVPIAGKLSDLYGRKPFFLGGVAIFVLASALCGAAQSMLHLVVFRGLQGFGAGFLTAMAFTSVGDLFPPARRGRVQGLFGAVFGLSSVVGPVLGGYITDNLSWRWVFYVNLPVGLAALAAVGLLYPHLRPARRQHVIDYPGAATLLLAVVPILLALSWGGREYAWTSGIIVGLFVVGFAMTGVFLWVERRAPEPIIPLDLFKNSIVSISIFTLTVMMIGMFGTLLFLPLFIQGVVGTSATVSGQVLTPMTVAMVVGSMTSGQIISRTGRYRRVSLVGMGLVTIGMFLLATLSAGTGFTVLLVYMLVLGVGLGMMMPVFTLVVQNAVSYRQLGVATSLTQFARSIGGTLGAAVFGSLLANRYGPAFHAALAPGLAAQLPPHLVQPFDNPQLLLNPRAVAEFERGYAQLGPGGAALLEQVLEAVRLGLASSIHDVFLVGALVTACGWAAVLLLREIPLRGSHHPSTGVAEPSRDGQL